ncbi:MAG: type I-MYXAN CRISPR-associated protein Cas6/Cmx6 [Gammaproteobacteria bacterium]|jgi:CRISPR-associated protein Cas6|nr:type I-MYXAN CRISPR-associated protein Cas6/Cmx6 [Gammaproteobacteria bacterium]
MYWQEPQRPADFQVPDDVVDVVFAIDCRELPVDHAHALSTAVVGAAPWLADAEGVGVHTVHVAGSQNGWERPAHGTAERLRLSRRTRLAIRAPKTVADRLMGSLPGTVLDVAGCRLVVGEAHTRLLSKQGTLHARYVVAQAADEREDAFLARTATELAALDIRLRRALCGKTTLLHTPDGPVATRSLMVADLEPEQAVRLQQRGLGPLRRMGCGLFIPHKGIDSVRGAQDD